jgi:hypothetical protein
MYLLSRKVAKLCALSLNNLALESGGERTIANNSGTGTFDLSSLCITYFLKAIIFCFNKNNISGTAYTASC